MTPPGGPPQLTPPTVIPQNPGESRVPNIGSGGGTLGRPSSIPNPLGYENAIEFRTPKPPRVPSYKYEPPPRRVDPPVLRSERPVAVRKMKPARKEPDEDAD